MTAKHIPMGEPVNNGERRVFKYLKDNLPDGYTLFTNLNINQGGQDFDFDAIVLGKHAIYAIEVKNIGGLIRGDRSNWRVLQKDGSVYTLPRNPLTQVSYQAKILQGKLKEWNPNLSKLYVQDCVCLAGEQQPRLEIDDDELRLKRVLWYRGIEKFLTSPDELLFPRERIHRVTDDIFSFHDDVKKAIEKGFRKPKPIPREVNGFTIEGNAWMSSRGYKAYFSTNREGLRALLKIYKIPNTENPEETKKYVDTLRREFAALKQIGSEGGHKNVAIGYDAFPLKGESSQQANEYVVAMEWVEGKPLFEYVKPNALPLRQKYQIAAQICRGLAFAHSKNVVHRNLNLKNILYTPNGIVKIVNFDFAKFTSPISASTFTVSNSMPAEMLKDYIDDLMKQIKYVAPEIRAGDGLPSYHDVNVKTDLYALGIILLELFSASLLENKPRPDLNILQSVPDLDPAAVRHISLLCSDKIEERASVPLDRIAKKFTALAQSMEEDNLPKLPDDYRFGKYKILSCISRTQMSDVYHAADVDSKQDVVIKFLRAASNDAVSEVRAAFNSWSAIDARYTPRWLGEGVAFALNGKIVDGSSDDLNAVRVHYLVMEHIKGQNIKKFIEQGVPTPEKAREIGSKIIEAVAAIHAAQWTHRDIKTANIILGADGSVRVVDFGLSQRIDEPTTLQGRTLGYTPPEVCQDEPADWSYAGDVYSTARVILALLFGENAPQGPDFDVQKDSGKLKKLVGNEIANLLLRDIDPNPKKRHESAVTMLQEWNNVTARREEKHMDIDYEKILQKIEASVKEKDDDLDYSGAAAYRNKANSLRTWLKNGRQGDCPVDLSEFGVDVIASPKPVADTSSKPVEEKKPDKPETISVEKNEEVVSLSPEERTLQEQLKEIREHLNAGRLRQAVALAGVVESRATGDAKVTASELLEEARQKRDVAVEVTLKKADSVFKKGDKQQARQHYEVALELDPDNERAKSAMRQIESEASAGKLSAQKIIELKIGLRGLKNIKRLGEAVYEAEALYAEGKLTKDLSVLLEEARAKYDQIRAEMGDETTMMRFGDLSATQKAQSKIADRMAKGEKYIYDATLNQERDSAILLREANVLLERKSNETTQYELVVINNLLPAYPAGAMVRLEKALSEPFHENDKRILREKFEEINKLLDQQKGAETFLSQAAQEGDEIKAFGMVLKAQGTFSYLPSMEVEIAQARTKAVSATVRKMEDAFAQARGMLGKEDSVKARNIINDALKLIDSWPLSEKPDQLQSLAQEGKRLLEFDTQVSAIRKEAEDPHNVGNALKKLEEVRKDARFADLPELRAFVSEMDQYRDSGDQLREAREARNQGEWKRVFELTTKIKESKKAGNLGAQVDILYAEAEQEVRIEDARALLDNLEIRKANSILSQIKATEKDASRRAILEKRLEPEQRMIDEAIANTNSVQNLYDRAIALRNGRGEERLEALRIFRYLGGISKEKFSADLPDYVLTLRTDDARKAAVEVGAALRAMCLDPLQKAYKGDRRKKADADDLKYLAGLAQILREGKLIHTPDEHSLARWAEVEWGKHQAKSKEAEQDWGAVIAIWSQLDSNYPDSEEVTKELSYASEQQKTAASVFERVDKAPSPRDALTIINDALENPQTKHLKGLKERREQIFLNEQDNLLKTARESSALGTNEGKLNAFVALVDLRDREDLIGLPENRRRSVAELKGLNPNDFKDVADGIIQQSNIFSSTQNAIAKSLQISGQLIARLQIFIKIAPLFSGRLFELDERLEKRKNELTIMHQKMKAVQALLEEANTPELWDDAISRGSFDVLKVKRDAMASQGLTNLPFIPDIKEFDQKMREMQEAYDHIKSQVTLIKQAFDVAEDFKQAVALLRRLAARPADWQVISQDGYERILNQMDYLFRVSNIFGGGKVLAGRAEIEAEALRRDQQFDVWFSWEKTCNVKMAEAKQAGVEVEKYETRKDAPINYQIRDWENLLVKSQSALDTLNAPPSSLREDILSKKVMDIFEASKQKINFADEWKYSAQMTLEVLCKEPKFPSPEEFSAAVTRNDLSGLRQLIAQAEHAGALAENETKRLSAYKTTYQRMLQASQKPKSWLDKLR